MGRSAAHGPRRREARGRGRSSTRRRGGALPPPSRPEHAAPRHTHPLHTPCTHPTRRLHATPFNLATLPLPYHLPQVALAASAGSLIVWHSLLPHGPAPNLGTAPRVSSYVTMLPVRAPHVHRMCMCMCMACAPHVHRMCTACAPHEKHIHMHILTPTLTRSTPRLSSAAADPTTRH